MKTYDDYFRAIKHVESDDPEAFTWLGIESTGLAEVLEEAEKHGYAYRLNCYDEQLHFRLPGGDIIDHHVRSMIFWKEGHKDERSSC